MPLKPNFFIVGAPKCGTTAMWAFLNQHPEIFMPEMKEPHYFATDIRYQSYLRQRSAYYRLFENGHNKRRVGEASVWYLYSETAAGNMHREIHAPKIVAMFRNPVDMLHSLHSQLLFSGHEIITDFREALDAEADRKRGVRCRGGNYDPKTLFYSRVADFAPQILRYITTFGSHNVHVIIYDDLRQNIARVFRECLEFLDVDKDFLPRFEIVNPNRNIRSKALQRLLRNPSAGARRFARQYLPSRVRPFLIRTLERINTRPQAREPIAPALRQQLAARFRPSIDHLSEVLGRDLTHWYRPSSAEYLAAG